MYAYAAGTMITKDDTALKYSESFRMMLDDAEDWAERSGLSEDDVADAVKSVRRRKKA